MLMHIDKQRRIAHLATVVALTLLPLFIALQLYSNHRRIEHVYHGLLASIADRAILNSLDEAASELRLNPEAPGESQRDPKLILARDFPRDSSTSLSSGCGRLLKIDSSFVSYDCAVLVPSTEPGIGDSNTDALRGNLRSLRLTATLRKLYGPIPQDSGLPNLLFAHALIKVGHQEAMVIYPATYLGEDYHFRQRPWYQKEFSLGEKFVSPLYHDYVYKVPALTFSKKSSLGQVEVRLGVDVPVSVPNSGFGVYFLNLAFLGTGALVYWRYSLSWQSRFLKLLLYSTALLIISYSILSANSLLAQVGRSAVASSSIAELVSFLPSGALLIAAGRALRARKARAELLWGLTFAAAEITCAALDLALGTSALSSAFAFLSLSLFGWYVFANRRMYDDSSISDLSPHPHALSTYMFVAYLFWGISQFARLFLSSEMPAVWRLVSHLSWLGFYRELLLDESSSYIVLMYAKAIAIFVTVLYLGAVDSSRYKREAILDRSAPHLDLDEDGRITNQRQLPISFPNLSGSRFADLLIEAEDRQEFEHAFREGLPLRSFLCRIGGTFQAKLHRVSLVNSLEKSGTRSVVFKHVERGPFLRALDLGVSKEFFELLNDLEASFTGEEDGARLLPTAKDLVMRRGRQVRDRAKAKLRAMAESIEERAAPRMDVQDAVDLFIDKLKDIEASVPGVRIRVPQDISNLPTRLRVSSAVFEVVVDCFCAEMEEVWRRSGQHDITVEVSIGLGCDQSDDIRSGLVSFVVRANCEGGLLENFLQAEAERMFGTLWALEQDKARRNILLLDYLLDIFGGKLSVVKKPTGDIEVRICIPYLFSSFRSGE